ncbi:hypothetical protein BST61_g2350 [Cercospora zeina]
MVPCGIIQGITNVDANQLNVLSEFIGGYMFQGKPLANMIFKILSTDVAQGFATVLGSLTQTGVTLWMLGNIKDICSSDQTDSFTCPNGRTVFSSSVIWGLVGPGRLYSVGKIYSSLLHFFWIGALVPVVPWATWKYTKKDNVPPAIEYWKVNVIFNSYIKSKAFAWWAKYNYILAAALDFGTAFAAIIIFFAVVSYPGYSFPDWWGNTVFLYTADSRGEAWKAMPPAVYLDRQMGHGAKKGLISIYDMSSVINCTSPYRDFALKILNHISGLHRSLFQVSQNFLNFARICIRARHGHLLVRAKDQPSSNSACAKLRMHVLFLRHSKRSILCSNAGHHRSFVAASSHWLRGSWVSMLSILVLRRLDLLIALPRFDQCDSTVQLFYAAIQ